MTSLEPRREFLKHCAKLGLVCASGCVVATATADENKTENKPAPKLPPLRSLAYCGLVCDREKCPLFKASVANDVAAKKAVFDQWKLREKYGDEFNPEKVFCFGCKPDGKPRGRGVSTCTTRACATDRGLESCLQCQRLASCDKELWQSWPDFRTQMLKLQQSYVTARNFVLG